MNIKKTILTFILCFTTTLAAENQLNYSKIITDIQIKGMETTPKKHRPTVQQLETKPGRKLANRDLVKDTHTLFLTGFFKSVETYTISAKNKTILVFEVEENPLIQSIQVSGNSIYSNRKLKKHLQNKKNRTFNLKYLQKDKESIENFYRQNGYELATVTKMDLDTHNTLMIHLSEGSIANLSFIGLSNIKPEIIRRTMHSKTETIFNSKTLRRDRERLLKLGYFSSVSPPQLKDHKKENAVQVSFEFKEKKANRVNLGLEQEDDQFVGFVQSIRNHNLIHSDVISAKFQISADKGNFDTNSYSLNYRQPWLFNTFNIAYSSAIWHDLQREYLSNDTSSLEDTRRVGGNIRFEVPLKRETLKFSTQLKNETVYPRENRSEEHTSELQSRL